MDIFYLNHFLHIFRALKTFDFSYFFLFLFFLSILLIFFFFFHLFQIFNKALMNSNVLERNLKVNAGNIDDKTVVLIVCVISICILGVSYIIFPDPKPTPIGLDQQNMHLTTEFAAIFSHLYADSLLYINGSFTTLDQIHFLNRLVNFSSFFSSHFKNTPEEPFAISALNDIWNTNFQNFEEIMTCFQKRTQSPTMLNSTA